MASLNSLVTMHLYFFSLVIETHAGGNDDEKGKSAAAATHRLIFDHNVDVIIGPINYAGLSITDEYSPKKWVL